MNETIHSFGPVADSNSRVLILGTMPSVASLAYGFYYGHPRNAFWPILARFFDVPVPVTIEEKCALILSNQLALWDVLESCVRPGSLDSDIREEKPNDFQAFFTEWPKITAVLVNGGTAKRLFAKYGGADNDRMLFTPPSTSPAYTLPFDQKYAAWSEAFMKAREIACNPPISS